MAKTFKEYITESFSKSFSYRIKLAGDFGPQTQHRWKTYWVSMVFKV